MFVEVSSKPYHLEGLTCEYKRRLRYIISRIDLLHYYIIVLKVVLCRKEDIAVPVAAIIVIIVLGVLMTPLYVLEGK